MDLEDLMKVVTSENNIAETAFAVKLGPNYHSCRFTPGDEIDTCASHAALATAFVLSEFVETTSEQFVFKTLSGQLTVEEDSICDSGHCHIIVPLWAKNLKKNVLITRQAYRRGGTLYCENSSALFCEKHYWGGIVTADDKNNI